MSLWELVLECLFIGIPVIILLVVAQFKMARNGDYRINKLQLLFGIFCAVSLVSVIVCTSFAKLPLLDF
jgi:hypothetical protein